MLTGKGDQFSVLTLGRLLLEQFHGGRVVAGHLPQVLTINVAGVLPHRLLTHLILGRKSDAISSGELEKLVGEAGGIGCHQLSKGFVGAAQFTALAFLQHGTAQPAQRPPRRKHPKN